MRNILILLAVCGLVGCVTNVYDKKQEGKTKMDGASCQNGVCTYDVDKGAAPEVRPTNRPPTPESTLPIAR